jgi:hypothetical protein
MPPAPQSVVLSFLCAIVWGFIGSLGWLLACLWSPCSVVWGVRGVSWLAPGWSCGSMFWFLEAVGGFLAQFWKVFGVHVCGLGVSWPILARSWVVLGVHVLYIWRCRVALGSLLGGFGGLCSAVWGVHGGSPGVWGTLEGLHVMNISFWLKRGHDSIGLLMFLGVILPGPRSSQDFP